MRIVLIQHVAGMIPTVIVPCPGIVLRGMFTSSTVLSCHAACDV